MRVPPPAEVWQRIPSWEWHKAGVQPPQSRTLVTAAQVAARLEEAVDLPPDQALTRLRSVPGIGEWTAAEVAQRALGSPDAISVGDYHLSDFVGWALLGRPDRRRRDGRAARAVARSPAAGGPAARAERCDASRGSLRG